MPEQSPCLRLFLPSLRHTAHKQTAAERTDKRMFRLWGKEFKDNRMLRDTVICDETDDTRTHKIFNALDAICYEFDLSKPIWLNSTISDFKRHCQGKILSG